LFREKERVPGNSTVTSGEICGAAPHFHPLTDCLVFATLAQSKAGGVAISLGILAKVFKARITISCAVRGIWVDLIQEIQHSSDRGVQAVQIQSVEPNALRMAVLIVISQPAHEIQHVSIAPHPSGKPLKTGKGIDGVLVPALKPHILAYAIRIRPVCLDGDCGESFFCDQAFGNLSAQAIELVSPVTGFSD